MGECVEALKSAIESLNRLEDLLLVDYDHQALPDVSSHV
jgi:hypothetical protein